MTKPKAKNRIDLLKALADEIGGAELAAKVESLDTSSKKRPADDEEEVLFDELANLVLDALDVAEMEDFKGLKESLQKKAKAAHVKQWRDWKKEAVENASQRVIIFCYFIIIASVCVVGCLSE